MGSSRGSSQQGSSVPAPRMQARPAKKRPNGLSSPLPGVRGHRSRRKRPLNLDGAEHALFFLPKGVEELKSSIAKLEQALRGIASECGQQHAQGAVNQQEDPVFHEIGQRDRMGAFRLRQYRQYLRRARELDPSRVGTLVVRVEHLKHRPVDDFVGVINTESEVLDRANERVAIGSRVKYLDLESGIIRTIRIGGYYTNGHKDMASYAAPIGQALMGADRDEVVEYSGPNPNTGQDGSWDLKVLKIF